MQKITNALLEKKTVRYFRLTRKALEKIRVRTSLSGKEKQIARDFLEMAHNYFSDAEHFWKNGDLPTALAAFSYAHAWLDAGVRAGILDGQDDEKLFTLPKPVKKQAKD